jgi:drug/metabolite transporter (DMT)-like permease
MVYSISGSLSIAGTVFGVLGSLALSMYSIYTKRILPYVNQQIWLLSYYNNVYSCLLFLPLIVLNKELPVILSFENLADAKFWLLMTGGGLCGFAIGFVTALQIQVKFHILQLLALFRFTDYISLLFVSTLVLYFICVGSYLVIMNIMIFLL